MFTNPVTASAETLLKQAGMTAQGYLRTALEVIDAELGEGAARKHPDLVAAFMHICARDYGTALLSQTLQEAATLLVASTPRQGMDAV